MSQNDGFASIALHQTYHDGFATFGQIYRNLSKYLPKNEADNMSPALVFLSVLNSATANRLRLQLMENQEDVFLIRKIA